MRRTEDSDRKTVFRAPLMAALMIGLPLLVALASGASMIDSPQVEISNGQLHVKVYPPDASRGFYRGVRFDWSGIIGSLLYKGHDYYEPWFDAEDPAVHDYRYEGSK